MKVTIIICTAVVVIAVISAIVFLSLHSVDTAPLMVFLGGMSTTLVPSILNLLRSNQTHAKVQELAADVETVKTQTNGPIVAMAAQVEEIHDIQKNGNSDARSI